MLGKVAAACYARPRGKQVLRFAQNDKTLRVKREREIFVTDKTYNVITPEKGVPIKAWTKGVPLEEAAQKQLLNVAQLPFIYKWVAAMPDVHWGIGATVGSVIPTRGAIIPAAVGVDI